MIPLSIVLNLDLDPWEDLKALPDVEKPKHATIERVGVLPNATQSGRACVELLIRTDDGELLIAETTLRLAITVLAAIAACPVAQMEDM